MQDFKYFKKIISKNILFYDDTGAASGGCIGKNSEFTWLRMTAMYWIEIKAFSGY